MVRCGLIYGTKLKMGKKSLSPKFIKFFFRILLGGRALELFSEENILNTEISLVLYVISSSI